MKILILYFSATGNTAGIADIIAKKFTSLGTETETADITPHKARQTARDLTPYDAVVFGFPVHSWRAPREAREWLHTLDGRNKRCSVFFTYGGFGIHPAHHSTKKILEEQGFTVVSSAEFLSPHTFNTGGWKAMEERPDQSDYDMAEEYAAKTYHRFTGEDEGVLGEMEKTDHTEEFLDEIENFRFRILTKLPTREGSECCMCRICEEACPSGAMNAERGKPDPERCTACLACVAKCPEDALKINDMKESWLFKLKTENISEERFNILIAEDSLTQREILKDVLKDHNLSVTAAKNGKIALQKLTENRFDLVISDIDMPVMNGYEFCSAIKHDERFSEIPVILLTSLSDTSNVALALQAGADNFITKPYDSEYLVSRIKQMIASGRQKQKSEDPSQPVEILHGKQTIHIDADRHKISEFLLSAYDVAVMKQRDLMAAQRELKKTNEHLKQLNNELTESKTETEMKHAALIGYMTEYTVRLKQPVELVLNNLRTMAEDFQKNDGLVDDEIIGSFMLQIRIMEQIFENLQSLNEEVTNERADIPDAYREFLKK